MQANPTNPINPINPTTNECSLIYYLWLLYGKDQE